MLSGRSQTTTMEREKGTEIMAQDKTQKIMERLQIKALDEALDLIVSLQIQVSQLQRGCVPARSPQIVQYIEALAKLDFFADQVSATHSIQKLLMTGETE
jgi:hypothetical protein